MMDSRTQALRGSDSRDAFKYLHKNELHQQFYALDIDFALVERNRCAAEDGSHLPLIVAILDFKLPNDAPTFSEVLAYNQLLRQGTPVYLVEANSEDFVESPESEHRLTVYEYTGGDWESEPPVWSGQPVLENATWREFEMWEDKLRIRRRNAEKIRHRIRNRVEQCKRGCDDITTYKAIEEIERVLLDETEFVESIADEIFA